MSERYWHFLANDKRLSNRDGRIVTAGSEFHLPDGETPILCHRGFHASKRAIDALKYAPGDVVCQVELLGTVIADTDKHVASGRRVVWMADAGPTLHEFACRVAEDALLVVGNPDPRSVSAIAAKRAWLKGEITDIQLAAAGDAARDAAGDAARAAAGAAAGYAARDAAWAAAWHAAWAAAGAAARAFARAAAGDAAGAAAWYAAWAAAGAAARAAAGYAKNAILERMLSELHKENPNV